MIGETEQKTNIRYRKVGEFETYNNAIDVDHESKDVIFTWWLYKLNTHHFSMVNRSQYGRGTVFKQDFVDYIGNNCYIPTTGICFIKCNNHLTDKHYTEDFSAFIRTEQRISNVMTSVRIQPFCNKHSIIIGCFVGFRVCPRNNTENNIALYMYKSISV